ncbi:putative nuclease HARBI1 [Bombyx mori]|uniref:DDE Tnp4 domain-containing protein n=2 Tax=Bombyx mori TaxID=7091 RepID=A0A8R2R968_BOMMO|nr:putative nuclease HARBI1 [Bombyx mori]
MAGTLMSSDSDSDLEVLEQLSDWDNEDTDGDEGPSGSRRSYCRIDYTQCLTDAEFTFRFRLNKAAVQLLLSEIMPHVKVTCNRNHGVAPLHQLLLTLRFYALGTMLISVADFVGVSKSTASRIVHDISGAIAILYNKYIVMHPNHVDKFFQYGQFPRVLGAIDCTHIRIQSPNHTIGEEFRNRKGYFSLNVQAVCDADLKFMNVVARWPGSAHDATIFNNSVLRAQCEAGTFGNRWLLADSAYPNRCYMLTPILNPSARNEQKYNDAHIATRNLIERTFGVWKRRFPVISLSMRLSLENIQKVIIATAVLHNICRIHNLQETPAEVQIPFQAMDDDDLQTVGVQDSRDRTELIEAYFSTM